MQPPDVVCRACGAVMEPIYGPVDWCEDWVLKCFYCPCGHVEPAIGREKKYTRKIGG